MAALVNKWLVASLFPVCFYIGGNFNPLPGGFTGQAAGLQEALTTVYYHPFHVTVVEVNHNAPEKTLEISCKLFTDDFEKILAKNYKTKVDIINPVDKKALDKLVTDYIRLHLSISVDGKPVTWSYLGFEREDDAVLVYLEATNIASVGKMEFTNKLMHDLFDDQTNIMHVIVGGKRKSSKTEFPATQASFTF